MFFRIKPSGERRYLQIVENTRDGTATRQRVLATLGRIEDLEASGKLDALLRSGARFSETAMLISSLQDGTLETSATARIGGITVPRTGITTTASAIAIGGTGFNAATLTTLDLRATASLSQTAPLLNVNTLTDGTSTIPTIARYRERSW